MAECYAEMGEELYVVGAAARDMAMKVLGQAPSKRVTVDLDVAVMVW